MPSLGTMTINALVASDVVLIPVQAAYLPVLGLQQLIKTIYMVKKRLNKKLRIGGILLTMVDKRTNYARDIIEMVKETYDFAEWLREICGKSDFVAKEMAIHTSDHIVTLSTCAYDFEDARYVVHGRIRYIEG